jgi:hypothetical protein
VNPALVAAGKLDKGELSMARFAVLALLCLAVATGVTAVASAAPLPTYWLPEQVEASFQESDLHVRGKTFPILNITCGGEGRPGPQRRGEWGIKSPTFHIFTCMTTVKGMPALELIHVETRSIGWHWEAI